MAHVTLIYPQRLGRGHLAGVKLNKRSIDAASARQSEVRSL